ncbi:MAG: hypothetical protein DRH57_04795 [Candidatus Cloacimonadota bacterium]|nr:MAG: hypothetical protein DRH57_04795 [Candidatus Cloacimonadota bacterium]
MTLSEMFKTPEEFIAYAEATAGMDFIDGKVKEWFEANQDFQLSYTGIQKVLNTMVVSEETPEEPIV